MKKSDLMGKWSAFWSALFFFSAACHAQVVSVNGSGLVQYAPGVYDVTANGAKCDNSTDDSAAINNLLTQIRNGTSNTYGSDSATVYFPETKKCLIKSTLNFTGFRFRGFRVRGGYINCQTTGVPCLDFTGSALADVTRLTIFAAGTPNIGIQLATLSGGGAQQFHFDSVLISGTFSLAALYNFGSEETTFVHCYFSNTNSSPSSYAIIQDGYNHFGVTSAFQTITAPADTGVTFNHDVFIGSQFQHGGGGSAIWIGGAARHRFDGYASVAASVPAVVVYTRANGGLGNVGLDFNMHFESAPTYDFWFTGGGVTSPTIFGFKYNEHLNQATTATFGIDTGALTSITFNNLDIDIEKNNVTTIPFFDRPADYTIKGGKRFFPNASDWSAPASASGMQCTPSGCAYN